MPLVCFHPASDRRSGCVVRGSCTGRTAGTAGGAYPYGRGAPVYVIVIVVGVVGVVRGKYSINSGDSGIQHIEAYRTTTTLHTTLYYTTTTLNILHYTLLTCNFNVPC